ncbi:MAG TPA: hypothetical protein VH372_20245 [Actinospica sp.]|jgi:hypothetical protein|nr:hypothetical protein [Actinospica sp.]
MTNAIAQALEGAVERFGKAAAGDASKAVEGLYRDTDTTIKKVVGDTVKADGEHASRIKSIADDMEANAKRTDITAGEKSGAQQALNSRLKSILEPGPAVKREDNDFSSEFNGRATAKLPNGLRKSHINKDGDLEPANPNGATSAYQHVKGGNDPNVKGSSPYTSFAPRDAGGKVYGAQEYELRYKALQDDIAKGGQADLKGVEVLKPEDVQGQIQGEIDKTAGKAVDVPTGGNMTKSEIDALANKHVTVPAKPPRNATPDVKAAYQQALAQRDELRNGINAMNNTRRDSEWLTKGTIPSRYLTKVR